MNQFEYYILLQFISGVRKKCLSLASLPGKQWPCIQISTAHSCLKCGVSKPTNQTNNPDARKGLLSFGSCKSERRGKKKGYVLKYRHRTECVDTTCKFIF